MKPANFERYIRYVWPLHRKVVRGLATRCKSCGISERASELDEHGACSDCSKMHFGIVHEKPATSMMDTVCLVQDVAEQTAGDSRAAVMVSGGKDSAFLLYQLKALFPQLELTAILVDNGFTPPIAIANARHITRMLHVDLAIITSEIPDFARRLRHAFLNLGDTGASGVVDFADGEKIYETAGEWCMRHDVNIAFCGLSYAQLEHILGIKEGYELEFTQVPHCTARLFCPIAAWRTPEHKIRKFVSENNLVVPGCDSPLVTNSDLVLPMITADFCRLGYLSFEPEFCQMIREGNADLGFWRPAFEFLEWASTRGKLHKDADRILSKLDLTMEKVICQ